MQTRCDLVLPRGALAARIRAEAAARGRGVTVFTTSGRLAQLLEEDGIRHSDLANPHYLPTNGIRVDTLWVWLCPVPHGFLENAWAPALAAAACARGGGGACPDVLFVAIEPERD